MQLRSSAASLIPTLGVLGASNGAHHAFASSAHAARPCRLVQWCHGAAGFIPTMVKAHEVLGGGGSDSTYLAAARRASDALWEKGLLKKGLGFCHGVAGNGYAFLSL